MERNEEIAVDEETECERRDGEEMWSASEEIDQNEVTECNRRKEMEYENIWGESEGAA